MIGSTILIASRLDSLRSERRTRLAVRREAIFLVNNLLLVGLAAVVSWGTFFPLISEAVTGEPSRSRRPGSTATSTPLAIFLVLFMGIGPLLAWRRVSAGRTLAGDHGAVACDRGGRGRSLALTIDAPESTCASLLFLVRDLHARRRRHRVLARLRARGRSSAAATSLLSGRDRPGTAAATAATSSTLGSPSLLFGIAASSSFQTSRDLRLQSRRSGAGRRLHGHLRQADHEHRWHRTEARLRGHARCRPGTAARSRR